MLGLGIKINGGSFIQSGPPPISELENHTTTFLLPGQPQTGNINSADAPLETYLDIRLFSPSPNFVGPVTKYTITSLTVENTTRSVGPVELITDPISLDALASFFGALYYASNDETILDNLDFGSSSSYSWRHGGGGDAGVNYFSFVMKITHDDYSGELTLPAATIGLVDSDRP